MSTNRPTPQTSWPLKPALASNRTAKTPITPRLAAAPSLASSNASQSGRPIRSNNAATTPRVNTAVREDVTPVKPFLSSNITPRSSSRKSRVGFDSASSTPSSTPGATPTSSRPTSIIEPTQKDLALGYGAPGGRPRSVLGQGSNQPNTAPRLPYSYMNNDTTSETGSARDISSLFFHANDAKPQEQPAPLKKAPTFFYADGKQDEILQKPNVPSPPLSNVGKPQPESKFFFADSLAEPKDRSPNTLQPSASVSSNPLARSNSTKGQTPRQSSPTKDLPGPPHRKGASQATRSTLNSRNSGPSASPGSSTPDVLDRSRRTSSASISALRYGHSKSASLSSIDAVTTDLKKAPANELPSIQPSPLGNSNRVVSNDSLPERMATTPPPPMRTYSGLQSPTPTSPLKANGDRSALEMMNELAANARRERKVLDLEISNSSLLAINRSLEKEVRKQKAELRRFRRMSRAGRFSVDTIDSAPEEFSAIGLSELDHLSEMSEEEEILEPEEEEIESSASSVDEDTLSPTAQAEWDEAHRLKDEKRLQLDLTKHRDLLVDSQKMNQSLKRCMNWTEQLIKDGQKALAYKVCVSDVKLGGRVLISEDDDHNTPEESKGLLSPWSPLHEAMEALDSPFFADPDRGMDRDSGVDVEGLTTGASLEAPEDMVRLGSPFEERIKHLQESIDDALEAS